MSNGHPAIEAQATFLYTQDLDATTPFYSETLGLELAYEQKSARFYYVGPSSFIGICFARPGRYVEPKGVVYTFLTPDVDGWYEYLRSRGATPLGPPKLGQSAYTFLYKTRMGICSSFRSLLTPHGQGLRLAPPRSWCLRKMVSLLAMTCADYLVVMRK